MPTQKNKARKITQKQRARYQAALKKAGRKATGKSAALKRSYEALRKSKKSGRKSSKKSSKKSSRKSSKSRNTPKYSGTRAGTAETRLTDCKKYNASNCHTNRNCAWRKGGPCSARPGVRQGRDYLQPKDGRKSDKKSPSDAVMRRRREAYEKYMASLPQGPMSVNCKYNPEDLTRMNKAQCNTADNCHWAGAKRGCVADYGVRKAEKNDAQYALRNQAFYLNKDGSRAMRAPAAAPSVASAASAPVATATNVASAALNAATQPVSQIANAIFGTADCSAIGNKSDCARAAGCRYSDAAEVCANERDYDMVEAMARRGRVASQVGASVGPRQNVVCGSISDRNTCNTVRGCQYSDELDFCADESKIADMQRAYNFINA